MNQVFVLFNGNAHPCRTCFANEYTERDRNRMYGLAWPSPHVNLTRACMELTPKTYTCSASSTTDAGWPRKRAYLGLGKNLFFCNQKTDSKLNLITCMWTVVLTIEVARRYICLTEPFDLSCVYHCNLLLNFFTVVNYIYIVVPRINGFLCKNKINEMVPRSFCGL